MSMRHIRRAYGVPAKRGMRVRFSGTLLGGPVHGRISRSRGQYLLVRIEENLQLYQLHPAWKLEYMEDES